LGTCHLLIAQRSHLWFLHVSGSSEPRVGFLMFHMSVFYGHVSCCGWVTCHFFIGPCGVFLLVHVVVSYSTTRHGVVRPRVPFLFGRMAWRHPSTCRFLMAHVSCPGYFTCHALAPPRAAFLFDHVAYPGSTAWRTIN
jgi:hypothetical protein